jgi:hypothetical protein
MEMVSYLAGEPHSDAPECACPVLTAFVVAWNDGLPTDADRDRLLKPFLPRLIGTRANADVEERRAFLAMDWVIRTFTPTWLDHVEALKPHAAAVRALNAIHDLATLKAATPSLRSAADAAAQSEAAAWAAARDAAWDAARAAAWAAAWAAARDAAWDAARDAARDAAWAAAWAAARDALAPTTLALQASAADLLDRMIAIQSADGATA